MKVGPKYKICRRLGDGVFSKCQTTTFAIRQNRRSTAQKKSKRPRGRSDYGMQLIEKQKVRFSYGVSERQLENYVRAAEKKGGEKIGETLYVLLESRLDNVVYRLGLATTRPFARQLVSHGHILVNGKRVTIPSYQVREGDKVSIRGGSQATGPFRMLDERLKELRTPSWLRFDPTKKEAEKTGVPVFGEFDANLDLSALFEFYSR